MATDWHKWKPAMNRYARQKGVRIPADWNPAGHRCGKACRTMIRRVKRRMGLKPDATPVRPWRRYSDRFTYTLLQHLRPYLVPPRPRWRRRARDLMALTVRHAAEWRYGQYRPADLSWTPGQTIWTDCSGGVIYISRQAGMKDPGGYGFSGYGNTTSMIANLRSRRLGSPAQLHVGDLVCWSGHVAMVYARGSDPLLWSHGFDGGPILIRLSVERRYHAGTPYYLPSSRR